jgi:hypothetical protein
MLNEKLIKHTEKKAQKQDLKKWGKQKERFGTENGGWKVIFFGSFF